MQRKATGECFMAPCFHARAQAAKDINETPLTVERIAGFLIDGSQSQYS
jgi:hypothetical protein